MLDVHLNAVSICLSHHESAPAALREFSCIMITAALVPKSFAAASLGSSTHFRAQQSHC